MARAWLVLFVLLVKITTPHPRSWFELCFPGYNCHPCSLYDCPEVSPQEQETMEVRFLESRAFQT
jgi:hypothetical protein